MLRVSYFEQCPGGFALIVVRTPTIRYNSPIIIILKSYSEEKVQPRYLHGAHIYISFFVTL